MRCVFAVVLALLCGALAVDALSAQESMAAKTTRERLQKKISIDIKEVGTKDFLEEISGELDNKVKFKIDNASGVSNNTKMSYTGKDIAVEKILNDLADKYDWGWFVISNAGNNTVDGKVQIRKSTKGKERGYEAGTKKTSIDRPQSERIPVSVEAMESLSASVLRIAALNRRKGRE
jgi:hypothetical protein